MLPPAIIIPNYRLSANPERPTDNAVHPEHVEDVRKALASLLSSSDSDMREGGSARLRICSATEAQTAKLLVQAELAAKAASSNDDDGGQPGAPPPPHDDSPYVEMPPSVICDLLHGKGQGGVESIYIAGHSCGAHMVAHLLDGPVDPSGDDSPSGSWMADARLRGIAYLDGIYDSQSLVDEYPDYQGFMKAAGVMGKDKDAPVPRPSGDFAARTTGSTRQRQQQQHGGGVRKIIVAHADADELLTPRQSREWFAKLSKQFGDGQAGGGGDGSEVVWDETTLKGTHDGCLHHPGLGELLVDLME